MYSRVTQLEIDTLRTDIADAVAVFRDDVVPLLHEQEGYEGALVLTTPDGKGMLITIWESADAAAGTSAFASEQLEAHVTLYRSPPGREGYDVSFLELAGTPVS